MFRRVVVAAVLATVGYLSCLISWTGSGSSSSSERMVAMVRQLSVELTHLKKSKAAVSATAEQQAAQILKQEAEIRRLNELLSASKAASAMCGSSASSSDASSADAFAQRAERVVASLRPALRYRPRSTDLAPRPPFA